RCLGVSSDLLNRLETNGPVYHGQHRTRRPNASRLTRWHCVVLENRKGLLSPTPEQPQTLLTTPSHPWLLDPPPRPYLPQGGEGVGCGGYAPNDLQYESPPMEVDPPHHSCGRRP